MTIFLDESGTTVLVTARHRLNLFARLLLTSTKLLVLGVDIHQPILLQFSLLANFFMGELPVKD